MMVMTELLGLGKGFGCGWGEVGIFVMEEELEWGGDFMMAKRRGYAQIRYWHSSIWTSQRHVCWKLERKLTTAGYEYHGAKGAWLFKLLLELCC